MYLRCSFQQGAKGGQGTDVTVSLHWELPPAAGWASIHEMLLKVNEVMEVDSA